MRRANEAILTRHSIPTSDELLLDMNGAPLFSKLDLKRLMFGISCAPDSTRIYYSKYCKGVKE